MMARSGSSLPASSAWPRTAFQKGRIAGMSRASIAISNICTGRRDSPDVAPATGHPSRMPAASPAEDFLALAHPREPQAQNHPICTRFGHRHANRQADQNEADLAPVRRPAPATDWPTRPGPVVSGTARRGRVLAWRIKDLNTWQ
jgi:hypothetical protein